MKLSPNPVAPPRSADTPYPPSSVGKACRILRELTQRQQARLTDIALATGPHKATVLGVGAASLALLACGRPMAAISLAALTDRNVDREAELAHALRQEAALCQSLMRPAAVTLTREEVLA